MERALADRPYPDDLKQYLLEQLSVPAERIRIVVAERKKSFAKILRTVGPSSGVLRDSPPEEEYKS